MLERLQTPLTKSVRRAICNCGKPFKQRVTLGERLTKGGWRPAWIADKVTCGRCQGELFKMLLDVDAGSDHRPE